MRVVNEKKRNLTHDTAFAIMVEVNMGGVRTAHSSLFFVASTEYNSSDKFFFSAQNFIAIQNYIYTVKWM